MTLEGFTFGREIKMGAFPKTNDYATVSRNLRLDSKTAFLRLITYLTKKVAKAAYCLAF